MNELAVHVVNHLAIYMAAFAFLILMFIIAVMAREIDRLNESGGLQENNKSGKLTEAEYDTLFRARLRAILARPLNIVPSGGATYEVSIAAATAVLGYDLAQNQPWKTAGRPRRLRGMALTGSAAAGDAAVRVLVGMAEVARKYNTTTGFPTRDHLVPVDALVPGGVPITVEVIDAPLTNPLNLLLDIEG